MLLSDSNNMSIAGFHKNKKLQECNVLMIKAILVRRMVWLTCLTEHSCSVIYEVDIEVMPSSCSKLIS